jgi:hypothetical protein
MPPPSISSAVRDILGKDINLSADAVIKKAKARGVTAPEESIRHVVHNLRGVLRKQAAHPVPAAARLTPTPKPATAPATSSRADLVAVFANVALVNKVVGACGGVENARHAAEAVRACGGVDAFLKHLDLVAGIRTGDANA